MTLTGQSGEVWLCALFLWAPFHSPAKLQTSCADLICFVCFHRHFYHQHHVASSSVVSEEIQCTIWWSLLPLIVPDSPISECVIISTGHPNGAEPLSLAVLTLPTELQRITRIRLKNSECALKSVWNPQWEPGQCECDSVAAAVTTSLLYVQLFPKPQHGLKSSHQPPPSGAPHPRHLLSLFYPFQWRKTARPFLWHLLSRCYHLLSNWMKR